VENHRRPGEAISERDGSSVLVEVHETGSARAAAASGVGAARGAGGIALRTPADGVGDAAEPPIVWIGHLDRAGDADAVHPEPPLLPAEERDDDQHHLDRLLELLPDVTAGRLVSVELELASQEDVGERECAGVDAVLVTAGESGPLVGDAPPAV